jgi:hypothetical protein
MFEKKRETNNLLSFSIFHLHVCFTALLAHFSLDSWTETSLKNSQFLNFLFFANITSDTKTK